MEEPVLQKEEEEDDKTAPFKSRKEKRKATKKEKRKQARKETAMKEREEEEKRLNDPEEQKREKLMEEEEAKRRERDLKEFAEREKELMERKRKEEEEEEREKKLLEDSNKQNQDEKENECDDWEYVEEGPAEIIWQGNEIIVRKKKVRVPKKGVDQQKEDDDRPTSNPLPPQSEAFADYQNASTVSAQQVLENVAQQVPNFGTEQDKAHCPFHLKTGACRFGQRCSRVHFYPDKSCTMLIKNMYNGPGLAWEQDEGLECTDEEVERCYEEFYEDVHTEFLKFGEIVNFKVCKNGSFHLRGNVYVHYKSLESAVLAYQSINGRYFAGKQVKCEYINLTRWKVAICGEYMRSRLKTCSHGTTCNFIHCFRNPGGDYEWADWDKPPPQYWVKKMVALFGYSDESRHEKQMEEDHFGQSRYSSKMITADRDRDRSRRSRSKEMDRLKTGSVRSRGKENDVRESTRWGRHTKDDQKRVKIADKKSGADKTNFEDYHQSKRSHEISSDEGWSDGDRDRHSKSSKPRRKVSEYSTDYGDNNITHEADSDDDWSDRDRDRGAHHGHTKKGSRYRSERGLVGDDGDSKKKAHKVDGDQLDRDGNRKTNYGRIGESSRHQSRVKYADNYGDQTKTDSIEDSLDGDRDGDRHRNHRRKRSGHDNEVSEFPGDHGNSEYGVCDTASSGDWVDRDKDRRRSHRRKRSRHHNELSESSDDEGEPRKKRKANFQSPESDREISNLERDQTQRHLRRRSRSSKEIGKADSSGNSLRSNGDHEPSCSDQYDERYGSRYNSDENINKQDRWEPESPKEDWKSRSKTASVERYESGTPDRYYGRNKSQGLSSENYYNEKIDKGGHWESEDDASEIKRKSRSKSSSDGKNSGELYDGSRPRVNSRSSRERHSKCMERETDSSVEYQEHEENYKNHRAKHTSDDHKRHDRKTTHKIRRLAAKV